MGSLSDVLEKEVLDHILMVGSYSPPATVYLALSTADPLDTGAGISEPVGNGYIRKAISFAAASGRSIVQTGIVSFDQNTGTDWGTITHYALFTAESGGVMMAHGQLSASKNVVVGNTPSVASGEVDVSINAGAMTSAAVVKVLDWLFRAQTFAAPTNLYVGLASVAVVDGDTSADVTDLVMTDYARANVNSWDAAAGASPALSDNTSDIDFGQLTGTGETVEATFISNVVSGAGDVYFYDNTVSQAVASGDTVKYLAGAWDVSLD